MVAGAVIVAVEQSKAHPRMPVWAERGQGEAFGFGVNGILLVGDLTAAFGVGVVEGGGFRH